ncbi:uncharacterized protein LOC142573847, partial [Dermacentor variabilis]|uniref:uncharacterized protein LOC142573847 n=1 Tax=Dermacentor variabilis TaxID=34621 RepID=UPI003F5C07C7
FSIKTHKPEWPLRIIVSEGGTWQKSVGLFLQRKLKLLAVDDPFLTKNSEEVIGYLKTHGFLELLSMYLRSTFSKWDGSVYLQKQGICIGSCIAPILSDLYLVRVNRIMDAKLENSNVKKVYRYVDDYLVLLDPSPCGEMFFEGHQLCWAYEPRAKKPLLPFSSGHSKLVKRGIAKSALMNALRRSCPHKCLSSFMAQVDRLKQAGFPQHIITAVAEGLLKTTKRGRQDEESTLRGNTRIGNNANVSVIFSAPIKLSNLCKASYCGSEKPSCRTNHKERYVHCVNNIVYELPLSCGKKYIGQRGRCLNDRLREHANDLCACCVFLALGLH